MSAPGGPPFASRRDAAELPDDVADNLAHIARRRRARDRAYGWPGVLIALGLLLGTGLLSGVPIFLAEQGVLAKGTIEWLIPTAVLTFYVGGLVASLKWIYGRDSSPRQRESDAVQAPYFPPASPSVPSSDLERRQLRLALFAETRLDVERANSYSAVVAIDLIIGGSLLLPLGLGLVYFTLEAVAGTLTKDEAEPLGLALAWLTFGLGVALLTALRLRRRSRREAQSAALRELASGLTHGELHTVRGAWLHWLNQHWAAPSEAGDLLLGPLEMSASGNFGGYPVLVEVEPNGYSDENSQYEPRVLVYVAALVPERFVVAERELVRLRSLGVSLEMHADAGLIARATPKRIKELRRSPAALGELRAVVECLVDIARHAALPPAVPDTAARARVEALLN